VKMLNGVQVPLQEDPWSIDPAVRKQTIEQEMLLRQQNPQVFPPVSQAAAALIQDYLMNLEQMGAQQTNAITGRTGVEQTDLSKLETGNLNPEMGAPEGGGQPPATLQQGVMQ